MENAEVLQITTNENKILYFFILKDQDYYKTAEFYKEIMNLINILYPADIWIEQVIELIKQKPQLAKYAKPELLQQIMRGGPDSFYKLVIKKYSPIFKLIPDPSPNLYEYLYEIDPTFYTNKLAKKERTLLHFYYAVIFCSFTKMPWDTALNIAKCYIRSNRI